MDSHEQFSVNFHKRSTLPITLKSKVFNQCVLPEYGAESQTLTKVSSHKLRATQKSMEKAMIKNRRSYKEYRSV